MMATEHKLPVELAASWVKDTLRLGPSLSLAKLVAETEDLHRYSFVTFAKSDLSGSDLTAFDTAGKAEGADDRLMDFLACSPLTLNGMYLVEDWRATPESQFPKKINLPAIFLGSEVYFIVRERDPRQIGHWRRIFSNTVPTFHAFLMDDDQRLIPGATISLDALRESVRRLRMIICGAYDGESYIVGTRNH